MCWSWLRCVCVGVMIDSKLFDSKMFYLFQGQSPAEARDGACARGDDEFYAQCRAAIGGAVIAAATAAVTAVAAAAVTAAASTAAQVPTAESRKRRRVSSGVSHPARRTRPRRSNGGVKRSIFFYFDFDLT